MAVTAFDGQFSFRQDSLVRLGPREKKGMTDEQWNSFQNSPFMQGVRKTEDLCWKFTCSRDERRANTDTDFKPSDDDFSAPKAHSYDKAVDYYKVLGLDEYARLDVVKKSYKKLSLVYHPDKTSGLSEEVKEEYAGIFIELKNAYLTLGDQATRRQYDRDRDRDQAAFEINGFKPKRRAHFDATEMLKKLQEMQKAPGLVVEVQVEVKLEKFFYGGHKRIVRQRRIKDKGVWTTEMRSYRVDIPSGAAPSHECAFKRQGDHNEDAQPNTIKFLISAKPHAVVNRQGSDLLCREPLHLGEEALRQPYVSAQTPSVQGRHLLLWGRNPFFGVASAAAAKLQVGVRGEGLTRSGMLRFTCCFGTQPATAATSALSKAVASPEAASATVVVAVRHMQTDARLWLRLPRRAVMGDVRSRIMSLCGLRRSATVRILQPVRGGNFTPYSDRRPLDGLDTRGAPLNVAGAAWYEPRLTPDTSRLLVQRVVQALESKHLQQSTLGAKVPEQRKEFMSELADIVLPDFGFEPTARALETSLAQARKFLMLVPDCTALLRRLAELERSTAPTMSDQADSRAVAPAKDMALREFLSRFNLGPPGGFIATSSSNSDNWFQQEMMPESAATFIDTKISQHHGQGSMRDAPAMRRRLQRRQSEEFGCEVELAQVGDPITLYTRPTCVITFYSNARQPSAYSGVVMVAPKPVFAISLSSPNCIKKSAAGDWELLKSRLGMLLAGTGFQLLRAARAVMPRAIPNAPVVLDDDDDNDQGDFVLVAGELDYEAFLAGNLCCRSDEDVQFQRCLCETARTERAAFLARRSTLESLLARSRSRPIPWKRLGDDAFRRGDYFTALSFYSHCPEAAANAPSTEKPTLLSNMAGCLARIGHFEASLLNAKAALAARPGWSRAWSRIGHAALALGQLQEATNAYLQAATLDPSATNIAALAEAVARQGTDPDNAHGQKEVGNGAMRTAEYGLAVAQYTRAMALLPLDPRLSSESAVDEFAFLRSVLYANRSAAFCRLKNWSAALSDARIAVDSKPDFGKAHQRLGTALLGSRLTEQAYSAFARALVLEAGDKASLRGRQECLKLLPAWTSQSARRRFHERWGRDLNRPAGSSNVYAISDVHFDHRCNEDWAHNIDDVKFQEDVLIVAGNMCDSKTALVRALTTFKAKFRRVFWVPGNHELWLHPSEGDKYADTFGKFVAMLDACDELDVDVFPAAVAKDLFIVPLFSWYNAEFDESDPFPDPSAQADKHCRWPIPESQVWRYMLKLNAANLRRPLHGAVISFSHFLPHRRLTFHRGRGAEKTIGCAELEEQVLSIVGDSRVHVYGHSTQRSSQKDSGIWYVNHYHGQDAGEEEKAPLLRIHDGSRHVRDLVPIF